MIQWKDVEKVDTFTRNRMNLYEKLKKFQRNFKKVWKLFYKNCEVPNSLGTLGTNRPLLVR